MATATPVWSDLVSVVAVQKVSSTGSARGTLNLSGKVGAYLFLCVGRLTSTAPATGIRIFVRRFLYDNGNSRDVPHPGVLVGLQDSITAANLTTLNGSPSHPVAAVTLISATGFAADQYICIVDNATTPTRAEWHHTSKIASATLTMDRNLANTSIASGDTITNQALVCAPVWVDGGPNTVWEVVFDYGPEANASHVVVQAYAQTLDSYSIA